MRFSMVNETILAIIIAFAISAALCPVIIPFLHRLKFGQQGIKTVHGIFFGILI